MSVIKLNTRTYKIKKGEGYAIGSKGLILSWRVKDESVGVPSLYINGMIVDTPRENKYIVSIPEIRNYIRNLEWIETPEEILLEKFENFFYMQQLYGTEWYKSLSNKELFDSLFTRDISKIRLLFGVGEDGPEEIEIEETYWDRKGNTEVTQTPEDSLMQAEISKIKPISGNSVLTAHFKL